MVVGCSDYSDDTAHVTAVLHGKSLQLSPAIQHKSVKQSLNLLGSCGYADLHPTNKLADPQKEPYLHFAFSGARDVELRVPTRLAPSGKIKVGLTEMVITLPLSSGIILVRSNHDILYFTKYYCKFATELEQPLAKAQKP